MMTDSDESLTLAVRTCAASVFKLAVGDIPATCGYGSIAEWDSVGHVDLLMALDAQYGFGLQVDHVSTLTGIPEIVAFLRRRPNA